MEECTITELGGGSHSTASLHYPQHAVDFRIWGFSAESLKQLVSLCRECLGRDFDVILEKTHLHVEFQPKSGVVRK